MLWDIFCKVIDNHGDIGVCWRLSVQLARRGEQVRLWVDDPASAASGAVCALTWMAPGGQPGVEVRSGSVAAPAFVPGDLVIETFGCEPGEAVVAAIAARSRAQGRQPAWINLEHLSAEPFVERSHGLPSPVPSGSGVGLVKYFFYPGFTPGTGGLLREQDLAQRQAAFDRPAWLSGLGIAPTHPATARLVSLFCYEPAALSDLLDQFARGPQPTRLLVTAGRASAAVKAEIKSKNSLKPLWNGHGLLSISYLPLLSQHDFDHLLWACDLNFVRGEDSLVRALWAGRPFVWQIYPQHDDAHHAKLRALLDWLQAPPSLRQFHEAWNGIAPPLPAVEPGAWGGCVAAARERLLAQDDLAAQLQRFVKHIARETS